MQSHASVDRSVLLIDDIRTQQAEIRDDVEARKAPYDDLSASDRNELLLPLPYPLLSGGPRLPFTYCAHQTSTVSSCAFCEQEGHWPLLAPF